MSELNDTLQIHINGQQTFFVSERVVPKYSSKLRKLIKRLKQRNQIKNSRIEIDDFPGGPEGFELISRFCYNNGSIKITVSNVATLHCCAQFLEMDEKSSKINLLHQTEEFLEGIFYWSWNDILTCLKSCDDDNDEPLNSCAESCGLIEKLLCSLITKITQNSDVNFLSISSSPSSSSPETPSSSCNNNSNNGNHNNPSPNRSKSQAWWFQDMTVLSPKVIELFFKLLRAYGSENDNIVLTRFLLHYLKSSLHIKRNKNAASREHNYYTGLAETAIHGVVSIGTKAFSCRGLLWVLRTVSGFGISRESKMSLEMLIAKMLDQATLDDLLVSGDGNGGYYDVNLVLRLIRLFVHYNDKLSLQKMKRIGLLIDMYLVEIGPDPNLKLSKFLGVAEGLPDCARDSYDQVYRAIDIYLQSHPSLSLQERSRLCRCINFEKLSLEACKDLAKNPRIPPRVSVQALASQHSNNNGMIEKVEYDVISPSPRRKSKKMNDTKINSYHQMVLYKEGSNIKSDGYNYDHDKVTSEAEEYLPEELKMNLEGMQWRVVELEKVCREMKGHIEKMNKVGPNYNNRSFPRLC